MTKQRPVHYQHYAHKQYLHTYCGLVNFTGYNPWDFTRALKGVTCKRCLMIIEKDGDIMSFKQRVAFWAAKRAK